MEQHPWAPFPVAERLLPRPVHRSALRQLPSGSAALRRRHLHREAQRHLQRLGSRPVVSESHRAPPHRESKRRRCNWRAAPAGGVRISIEDRFQHFSNAPARQICTTVLSLSRRCRQGVREGVLVPTWTSASGATKAIAVSRCIAAVAVRLRDACRDAGRESRPTLWCGELISNRVELARFKTLFAGEKRGRCDDDQGAGNSKNQTSSHDLLSFRVGLRVGYCPACPHGAGTSLS